MTPVDGKTVQRSTDTVVRSLADTEVVIRRALGDPKTMRSEREREKKWG